MAAKKRQTGQNLERGPPRREIDKLQAIRHLLHASIRMLFSDEDPFALHLVCQSCDKLITDCLTVDTSQRMTPLADAFADLVKPGYRKAFFKLYREVYNYLKHADTDRHLKLGVHHIVQTNEMSILMNIRGYNELLTHTLNTKHARYYLCYAMIMFKNLISPDDGLNALLQHANLDLHVADSLTRTEVLAVMRKATALDKAYLAEKNDDLVDISYVAHVSVKDYQQLP
jgi:hypothetical protein